MEILQLIKDAMLFFQEIEPGVVAAAGVGAALKPAGTAAIQVLQKGRQLVTYWISRRKEKDAPKDDQPEKEDVIQVGQDTAPVEAGAQIVTREDVAVLVDINRRMLVDVGRYLEKQGIEADVIIVTNDPLYSEQIKFLDANKEVEWEELVREFATAMNAIKRVVGGARLHIFLSTPLSLAFGMGCVWGTVDEAVVYHWENQSYHPVMNISRRLRQ